MPQLLQRTLPALYNDADFSVPPEFLSKELRDTIQRPTTDEQNAPLFVDELIKIYLKNGQSEWILLHIEIQGSGGDNIFFRMMLYCSLIFAHHRKMPVGLAILTKPRPKGEIIGNYTTEQYGSSIAYKYNCLEVYKMDEDSLRQSDNPFDLIFLANKNTINLSGKNKEEKKMRTLSFVEEYFRDKGLAEGREMGLAEGRAEGLVEGKREANFETARRLRTAGMSDDDIHKFTDLSFEDIRSL